MTRVPRVALLVLIGVLASARRRREEESIG